MSVKILFLTYDLPYPLNSGGKIRAYYLIKGLAKKYKICLFSYYRQEEQKKYLPELAKFCAEVKLFKRGKPWTFKNISRSVFSSLPFASSTYISEELKEALMGKLKGKERIVAHFESYYPALYLPLVKNLGFKVVMGNENLEYNVYSRFADKQFFGLRNLLSLEASKMRLFEEDLWRQADMNLAVSDEDAQEIKRITGKETVIIPNGVDFAAYEHIVPKRQSKKIVFIGTLIYPANSDAVKYFLSKIYPQVKKKVPEVNFVLVSWYKPDWLAKFLDSSITFIQDKETPAVKFQQEAAVFVAPMRIAGGTNIKILEAMAAGLPVVTNKIGIEGIKVQKDRDIIVEENPEEFAKEIIGLLESPSKADKIGLAGKSLVKDLYSWQEIGESLAKTYERFQEN